MATGVILFSRPSAAQSDITIPAGTICAPASESGGLIEFQTTEAAVLEAGYAMAYVEATDIKAGTAGNVSTGAISINRTPIVGGSRPAPTTRPLHAAQTRNLMKTSERGPCIPFGSTAGQQYL